MAWCRALTAFQSTPAITGGRDFDASRVARTAAVSIHARHYWRARHCGGGAEPTEQSFNPRPPLLAGETIPSAVDVLCCAWFQSTPAITGGRDGLIDAQHLHKTSFNPRPPLLAGETRSTPPPQHRRVVSIHARHYWRARHDHQRYDPAARCFNPRPPLLAGETRTVCHRCRPRIVSIHARHYWRARREGPRP